MTTVSDTQPDRLLKAILLVLGAGLTITGVVMSKSYPHVYGWVVLLGVVFAGVALLWMFFDWIT